MKILSLKIENCDKDMQVKCKFLAGEMTILDLEAQMAVTPKLAQAWDLINDVMGLAYDFHVLRDKVDEAMSHGEDITELLAARNAALKALRAPI